MSRFQDVARSWWQDEPQRLAREQAAMAATAPDLAWLPGEPSGGWQGTVPLWPFNRPEPQGCPRCSTAGH